jgi:glycosyltransferase involved in cell wall biosynthesis
LVALLKKIDPHIVHVQGFWMGSCGLVGKKLLKKPYVVWSQGHIPLGRKCVTTIVLRDADAVIALSDHMKEELQRMWPRDISIIPNGIDLQRFETVSQEAARSRLGIGADERIVLYVGRLDSVKGLPYLVEAINLVKQREPRAHLVLVGDGPEREKLELLVDSLGVSKYVRFVGRVEPEGVPVYLAAGDVFVLPSVREGFGIVILEAMAAELPIVATNVGGIPSIIENETNGFLVEPQDAAQIADKVSLILNSPQMKFNLSKNNREKVQKYSWDSSITALEKVYSDCLRAT